MAHPLMPKATAVWLVENTALTFEQIAEFCGLHELEVQAIADGEVAVGMQGLDPIAGGELTQDELDRCAKDPKARLKMAEPDIPQPKARSKGARYTPVSKRQDRPDAIAWLLRNHPELSDGQISKLIGTTKPTINAIRERTHWNMPNIKPQNPIGLGLCSAADLEKVVGVARARAGTADDSAAKPSDAAATSEPAAPPTPELVQPLSEPPSEPPAPSPAAPPEQAPESAPEPASGPSSDSPPPTPEVLKAAEEIFASPSPPEAPAADANTADEKADERTPAPGSEEETGKEAEKGSGDAPADAGKAKEAAPAPDAEADAKDRPDDAAKSS